MPDPWAAAVEAYIDGNACNDDTRHDAGQCPECVETGLRAAMDHLLEAVVGEMEAAHDRVPGEGAVWILDAARGYRSRVGRLDLLTALQRAAAERRGAERERFEVARRLWTKSPVDAPERYTYTTGETWTAELEQRVSATFPAARTLGGTDG